jgi:hypothetical protein
VEVVAKLAQMDNDFLPIIALGRGCKRAEGQDDKKSDGMD